MSDSADSSDSEVYIPRDPVVPLSANLDKLKVSDETVRGLHRLLFGRVTATKAPKSDIKAFYGFADLNEREEEAYEEKLGKWTVGGLRELLDLFNLEANGDKDALIERLMVFLKKPSDSGLVPRAQRVMKNSQTAIRTTI
ncbi:MAG: hypothetical protein J3Q66DRAFT_37876 [Benniella sp.]|nr:MAG: hypothetical protein J3Q66DRAFT_37876 [Benniella sp.]